MSNTTSFYDLAPLDKVGQPFLFSQLRDKVVLIVNVASRCGYTPQYKDLERLYKKYKSQGLVIIGFPCNQFGNQEPGTDAEIASFCKRKYDITFPVLKKIEVNGPGSDPVYEFLTSQQKGTWGNKAIRWNFEKFLVDKNGDIVYRCECLQNPLSLTSQIEVLLKA